MAGNRWNSYDTTLSLAYTMASVPGYFDRFVPLATTLLTMSPPTRMSPPSWSNLALWANTPSVRIVTIVRRVIAHRRLSIKGTAHFMNKLTLGLFNIFLLLYLCCVYGAAVSVLRCECVLCVSVLNSFFRLRVPSLAVAFVAPLLANRMGGPAKLCE